MKQTVFKSIVERLYDGFFNKEEEKNYIELEKQQIIDSWLQGVEQEGNGHGHTYLWNEKEIAEQYYNETFNK